MDDRARLMMLRRLVLLIAAVAVLALLVVVGARLRPWMQMPVESRESIERRWDAVVAWAEDRSDQRGNLASLRKRVDQVVTRKRSALAVESGSQVSARMRWTDREKQAVADQLVDWHKAGELAEKKFSCGALSSLEQSQWDSLVDVLLVASANDANDARVVALLHLAYALRNDGDYSSFLHGIRLARKALDWAEKARVPIAGWDAYRPRVEEVFPALARAAVCGLAPVLRVPDPGRLAAWPTGPDIDWPPFGLVRPDREILVSKAYYADELGCLVSSRHNSQQLIETLAAFHARKQPKSALLPTVFREIIAGETQRMARDHSNITERWNRYVLGRP